MKIKDIRLIPLVGATPDGGWQEGDGKDDNLHTLVEVITDEGCQDPLLCAIEITHKSV